MDKLEITTVPQLQQMGQILAASKMFGTQNAAECVVIAGMCQQEGISYMEFMRKYHMISGRVSMRADAMLGEFQRLGGKYKVVRRDTEGAIIDLEYKGCSYTSRCIWEEVKDEDFCNAFDKNTGKRVVKDNYTYPRKRMQMLWARAVSDGVRVICPQVVQGVYTPEEINDSALPPAAAPAVPVRIPASEVRISPPPTPDAAPAAATTPAAPQPQTAAPIVDLPADAAQKTVKRTRKAKAAPAAEVEVAPAAAPAAPDADAMPEAPAVDITICPIKGQLYGHKWGDIDTSALKWLLARPELPEGMTQDHIEAINLVLQAREAAAPAEPANN